MYSSLIFWWGSGDLAAMRRPKALPKEK